MSMNSKVVWSEGMFLQPQHFQQQDRYLENYIHGRSTALSAFGWGFQEIALDNNLLKLGKISIIRARGVLPDGTPFSIPDVDDAPPVLDVPENLHNQEVYLALPVRRQGVPEVAAPAQDQRLARYASYEAETFDSTSENGEPVRIQIGKPRFSLLLESQDRSGYACIGLARITESREDKLVILDELFVPPCVDCRVSSRLIGFLNELGGLLHHRGEALAGRLIGSGRAGTAEIADYMLLQLVNRLEPLVIHLSQIQGLHPERLYSELVQMVGELATFTGRTKRPPKLNPYLHDRLQETFGPIMSVLRQALSTVLEQSAISLELVERKYGIRVSPINDRSLIGTAVFVLAVKADVKPEMLRKAFPAQAKLGPVEKIRDLVNLQLPGVGLNPLPVAPRQIPYRAGYTYFELDRASDFWRDLKQSGGFALHVGADFPGIELEFWAIRE